MQAEAVAVGISAWVAAEVLLIADAPLAAFAPLGSPCTMEGPVEGAQAA